MTMLKRAIVGCLGGVALAAQAELAELSLNGTWDFAFERGAKLTAPDAGFAATDKIVVPGCYDLMPKWYAQRGLARYRRTFTLDRPVREGYLLLRGVGLQARFNLDGRDLGTTKLPYSTIELKTGPLAAGEHVLACTLDNNLDGSMDLVYKPNYDFYLAGGFYHGVSLKLQYAPVELDRVVVRTRDYKTGTVELTLEAKGALPETLTAQVSFDQAAAAAVPFAKGKATLPVPDPTLWSPEHPNLHTVTVACDQGCATARFGIRQIAAHDKAFWLNGEKLWLKGVNRHESDPLDGYATSMGTMYRDIQLMKSIGCNYVRGSHYPQRREFLNLCDELGLMVWEESLGWGNWKDLDNKAFQDGQIEQTRLMARASINHPCIIISGYLNEFGSERPEGRALSDRLIDVIRAEDTGHLVGFASSHGWNDESNDKTDFIAFNLYPSWHGQIGRGSTPESLSEVIKEQFDVNVGYLRKRFGGDKPLMISETGCYSLYGNHDPMGAQWSEEFQAEYLENFVKLSLASPEMSGFTVWQFADSRTYFRGGSDIRIKPMGYNMAGLFDRNRNPKAAATMIKRYYTSK